MILSRPFIRYVALSLMLTMLLVAGFCLPVNVLARNGGVPTPVKQPAKTVQQGGIRQTSAAIGQNEGPEQVLIVLDASYSMAERLPSGETKMAAAKRVILEVLQKVSPDVNVGLRVYGDRDNTFTACSATSLLAPIAANNRNTIASQLVGIKPTGATPISHTLVTAINQDFYGRPGKKSIILVSDGMETCDADPCQVAVDMVRQGIDVKINVVGFGLTDFDATRQLKCVALSTKGQFYSANTAGELAQSLGNSLNVRATVEGRLLPKSPANSMPSASVNTVPVRNPESPPPGYGAFGQSR